MPEHCVRSLEELSMVALLKEFRAAEGRPRNKSVSEQ
jgi:hypothetical protein